MKTRTAVHMLHEDTAAAELHDPAAQFRQANRPDLGVYLPAEQEMQILADAPVASENLPAGQGLQTEVKGAPHEPAEQQTPEPAPLLKPTPQGAHEATVVAPKRALKVFGGQFKQLVMPMGE